MNVYVATKPSPCKPRPNKAGEDVFARDAEWHRALAPNITKDGILQTVYGGLEETFRAIHETRSIDFILEAISHTPNVV